MKSFDWEKFKNVKNRFAVHCKTKKEAEDFCHRLAEKGCCWSSGDSYSNDTKWGYYKKFTCYSGDGQFADVDYYERHYYKIIKWSDYMKEEEKDAVNHPSHYNREGSMECIDEMLLLFGPVETMSFCKLNAWKYRNRAPYKGTTEQDMKKSDWYLKKYKELKERHEGI